MVRLILTGAAALGLLVALGMQGIGGQSSDIDASTASTESIQRGRDLVQIGGCNDCHTPGYAMKNGNVPESQWLIGDDIGFNGPWGTTYAANLRSFMRAMPEDDWVRLARVFEARPPMPWFNVRAMSNDDLRAIYRYIRALPADETRVPEYVPPGQKPRTPYYVFAPQEPR